MKLETDARVHAQAYIHGHNPDAPAPCKIACALIRNLLDDLSAANCEIRALGRDKVALQRRIEEQYELVELANKNKDRSKDHGHNVAAPEARRPGNSG